MYSIYIALNKIISLFVFSVWIYCVALSYPGLLSSFSGRHPGYHSFEEMEMAMIQVSSTTDLLIIVL